MKQFWVDARPWNKEIVTTAIESGADAVVADRAGDVKRLGRITTVAPDGDRIPGKDVIECTITDKASENEAAQKGKNRIVIVTTSDWTVIPLENLVAQSDKIVAAVKNVHEAELALHVLEKGVFGILLKTTDPAVVKAVAALIKNATGSVQPHTLHGHEDPARRHGRPGLRGHLLDACRWRRHADGEHLVCHAPRACRNARKPVRRAPPVPGERRRGARVHPDA